MRVYEIKMADGSARSGFVDLDDWDYRQGISGYQVIIDGVKSRDRTGNFVLVRKLTDIETAVFIAENPS